MAGWGAAPGSSARAPGRTHRTVAHTVTEDCPPADVRAGRGVRYVEGSSLARGMGYAGRGGTPTLAPRAVEPSEGLSRGMGG